MRLFAYFSLCLALDDVAIRKGNYLFVFMSVDASSILKRYGRVRCDAKRCYSIIHYSCIEFEWGTHTDHTNGTLKRIRNVPHERHWLSWAFFLTKTTEMRKYVMEMENSTWNWRGIRIRVHNILECVSCFSPIRCRAHTRCSTNTNKGYKKRRRRSRNKINKRKCKRKKEWRRAQFSKLK